MLTIRVYGSKADMDDALEGFDPFSDLCARHFDCGFNWSLDRMLAMINQYLDAE